MNIQHNSKLKISLNNLDDITQNTLKFFFKSNLCEKAELNINDDNANVLIIDLDRQYNKEIIPNLKKNNQFVIFLHNEMNTPLSEENTYNVTKPVQVKYLKQQLSFIAQRINDIEESNDDPYKDNKNSFAATSKHIQSKPSSQSLGLINNKSHTQNFKNNHLNMALKNSTDSSTLNQYKAHKHVGSNRDINLDNPEELNKIYHNPKKYLYHYLVQAVKLGKDNKSDVLIKTLFGSLFFDYKSQVLFHSFDNAKMRYFKSSPLFIETKIVKTSLSEKEKKDYSISQNAESLIWQSAIGASKGRLPLGTSLTQTIEMTSWPNFSRLLIFRYVIQIAAAWSTHHMSLLDTASQLKIPQRYIFTLYNAMLAIESAKINNVIDNTKKINRDKKKSVFSKILSHIFNH